MRPMGIFAALAFGGVREVSRLYDLRQDKASPVEITCAPQIFRVAFLSTNAELTTPFAVARSLKFRSSLRLACFRRGRVPGAASHPAKRPPHCR